jgi:hypothetical protein
MGWCRRGRSKVITSHCEGAIVTPDTLLAWHRKLIAHRYDGFRKAPDATAKRSKPWSRWWQSILDGARRCGLSCSKRAADSARTTHHPLRSILFCRLGRRGPTCPGAFRAITTNHCSTSAADGTSDCLPAMAPKISMSTTLTRVPQTVPLPATKRDRMPVGGVLHPVHLIFPGGPERVTPFSSPSPNPLR